MASKLNQKILLNIIVRNNFQYGDLGKVLSLHGEIYQQQYGFNHEFEAYVAEGLAEFALIYQEGKSSLWIAEERKTIVGSISILERPDQQAQLRWFLVRPDYQGIRLGKHLFDKALNFCHNVGYKSVYLWTLDHLSAAKIIYVNNGFRMREQKKHYLWGHHLIEEYYTLDL